MGGGGDGDEGKARTRKRLELQPRKEVDRHRAGTGRAATGNHCPEGRIIQGHCSVGRVVIREHRIRVEGRPGISTMQDGPRSG